MIKQIDREDIIRGCFLGMACGDALGVGVAPGSPGQTPNTVTQMTGGGPYDLKPGEWTAPTTQCLCLAESLIKNRGWNAEDILETYQAWYEHGFWSSRDFCFGMEPALRELVVSRIFSNPITTPSKDLPNEAGFLSSVAPISLIYWRDPVKAMELIEASIALYLETSICKDLAQYTGLLLYFIIDGKEKKELFTAGTYLPYKKWDSAILELLASDYLEKPFVAHQHPDNPIAVIQAALWSFAQSKNFKDGALKAVNLGGQASIVGALYGQIAGLYYGAQYMPDNWIRSLSYLSALEDIARRMWRSTLLPS